MIDESKLRELVAAWLSHWTIVERRHLDPESIARGSGIESCAYDLQALLDQSSAHSKE